MRFGGLFPDRKARTLNQTVKVCSSCNSGWMSRLESAARPLLERLIEAQPTVLRERQQAVLAGWLTKNAVLHDWLLPRHQQLVTAEQRRGLPEGLMPPGWQVHLGVMAPDQAPTWQHICGAQVQWHHDDGSRRGRCQLHTTAWHRMAAQVLVHNLDVNPESDGLLGGSGWSTQIAPYAGVQEWPPAREFTAEWLEIVAHPAD